MIHFFLNVPSFALLSISQNENVSHVLYVPSPYSAALMELFMDPLKDPNADTNNCCIFPNVCAEFSYTMTPPASSSCKVSKVIWLK